jgi:hypothetical protein
MTNQAPLFGITVDDIPITSDDYYTPNWIFEALGEEFDLDPAHPPRPTNSPCKRYLTMADDGLVTPWEGFVWMNPPYSKPSPWMDKFREHGNGLALVQVSKARWFKELFDNPEASFIFLPADLKFNTSGGELKGIFMATVIVGMGERARQAMQRSGLGLVR